jgi:hypothetical protein
MVAFLTQWEGASDEEVIYGALLSLLWAYY